MPAKKTSSKAKGPSSSARGKSADNLMEFEQFVSRQPAAHHNKVWMFLTLLVVVIALGLITFFTLKDTHLQKDLQYKAVYVENGQVYYAKIVREDEHNLYLDDVFYIQTTQQTIPATEEGGEDQVVTVPILVPRGDEIHKPVGYLEINRDKVVAIDQVGADSDVYAEIQRIKQAMAAQAAQQNQNSQPNQNTQPQQ